MHEHSGYRGVIQIAPSRWVVYIYIKEDRHTVGRYRSLKEAVDARNAYIVEQGLLESHKLDPYKTEQPA